MNGIVGNEKVVAYLENAVQNGETAHAYLFCGPKNVGKTKIATEFAKTLLCEGENPSKCTDCPSCKLFASGNHPDFFLLDQESVLIDEIRDLTSSLELKSYLGRGKVALISHAEGLTSQALNAFLKTLEEPTTKTTIILTTENKKNLLPTIVSRARAVNFSLVSEKSIFEHLNGELGVKKEEASRACALAAGRVGVAVSLSRGDLQATDLLNLATDFKRIYRSSDIYEKIMYADTLSKDKEGLLSKLQTIELSARRDFLGDVADKGLDEKAMEQIGLLDLLASSTDMINKNANTKLVMERLLLGGLK